MKTHDYNIHAKEYSDIGIEGTFYLAFRDIPSFIKKYVDGKKALDYGCGGGRSSRWLKGLGFETTGVDISDEMLQQARQKDADGNYQQINGSTLPFGDGTFDLAFSSFVFLEVPSISEIETILKEVKRVLKANAHFIFVTSSEIGYKGEWLSLSYNFPENQGEFKSGDKVKLNIRGTEVILFDYYWTHQDFLGAFESVGFTVQEHHQPIGLANDGIDWRDERDSAPWTIYILQNSPAQSA